MAIFSGTHCRDKGGVLVSIIQRGSRSLFRLRWKIDCYTDTHTH